MYNSYLQVIKVFILILIFFCQILITEKDIIESYILQIKLQHIL